MWYRYVERAITLNRKKKENTITHYGKFDDAVAVSVMASHFCKATLNEDCPLD